MLEDLLMPRDDIRRVEGIAGVARPRCRPAGEKLRIIEESPAPNLSVRRLRLMDEGGHGRGIERPAVGASETRELEERVRDLERLLGRRTMETEILREALAKAQARRPT